MYYVLYSPKYKQYVNVSYNLAAYCDAVKFTQPTGADLEIGREDWPDLKWVGPCEEGKEP